MTRCFDCSRLTGRPRDICDGTAELPDVKRDVFLATWLAQGRVTEIDCPQPHRNGRPKPRGLGDRVSRGIGKATGGLVKPCGGCKQREAWLNHHFPADLPPVEPVALDAPVRHLMMHLWPVKGFGAWQWNIDRLKANAGLFNGRRIVAVVTSKETDSVQAVRDYLGDFPTDVLEFANNAKLREVVSWIPMLERLEPHQSDRDMTFACHGKCVRHKIASDDAGSTVFRWTQAMYDTCLDWPTVRPLLETHGTVGSFRRFGKPQKGSWGPWHFSGTFFWFRNRDAFRRNWRYVVRRFYGTEAWPGHMFRETEAACIVCDRVGDLYRLDHWERDIEPQLREWRASRAVAAS